MKAGDLVRITHAKRVVDARGKDFIDTLHKGDVVVALERDVSYGNYAKVLTRFGVGWIVFNPANMELVQ